MSYPTDSPGRTQLADELTAAGFVPTQDQHHFDALKIDRMVAAMRDGSFDWAAASLRPVILGPSGEIVGGHHRIVAAHLAGIDLSAVPGRPQVRHISFNARPVYDWIDVIPAVP